MATFRAASEESFVKMTEPGSVSVMNLHLYIVKHQIYQW